MSRTAHALQPASRSSPQSSREAQSYPDHRFRKRGRGVSQSRDERVRAQPCARSRTDDGAAKLYIGRADFSAGALLERARKARGRARAKRPLSLAAPPREVAGFLPEPRQITSAEHAPLSPRHFCAASNIRRGAPVTSCIAGHLAHSLVQAGGNRQPEKPEKSACLTRPLMSTRVDAMVEPDARPWRTRRFVGGAQSLGRLAS
jgi:hypothetical protein